jgi:hypothetical protein
MRFWMGRMRAALCAARAASATRRVRETLLARAGQLTARVHAALLLAVLLSYVILVQVQVGGRASVRGGGAVPACVSDAWAPCPLPPPPERLLPLHAAAAARWGDACGGATETAHRTRLAQDGFAC